MRPLVGVGGVILDAEVVGPVQRAIDEQCREAGFPAGEEFKWSPGRELWMWKELRGQLREKFFISVLKILAAHEAVAIVIAVDQDANPATNADTPEEDATRLFLERASNRFVRSDGVVIVDRPTGDRAAENRFLADCVMHLQDQGTYAIPERFALPVMAAQSRFVRLLQAADLVTSCSLAYISGEQRYSPPVFDAVKSMFPTDYGRKGGIGLKIHPDFRYLNLYHWLLGDSHFVRFQSGYPLPMKNQLYADGDGSTNEM